MVLAKGVFSEVIISHPPLVSAKKNFLIYTYNTLAKTMAIFDFQYKGDL